MGTLYNPCLDQKLIKTLQQFIAMAQQQQTISIRSEPTQEQLEKLGVFEWSIWEKEVSEFPWSYGEREICYFLSGDVVVTPDAGNPVKMGKGYLVTFPAGMSCIWKINQAVKKHYKFG